MAGSRQGGWNPESNKGPWNMEGHDRQRYKAWHWMMMIVHQQNRSVAIPAGMSLE